VLYYLYGVILIKCVLMSLAAKMAHAALRLYRQSLSLCSVQRIGIESGLQVIACVAVRNFVSKMGRPRVYFDMSADGQSVGRIVMEVSRFSTYTFIGSAKNSVMAVTLHCDHIYRHTMYRFLARCHMVGNSQFLWT
jgi:hypothetical protein